MDNSATRFKPLPTFRNKTYWNLYLRRTLRKNAKYLIIAFVFIYLIIKNSEALYYNILDIVSPIQVNREYSLFNGGNSYCEKSLRINNKYTKSSQRFIDPNYSITKYESNKSPETMIVSIIPGVEEFKETFSSFISLEGSSLSVLIENNQDSVQVERFLDHQLKTEKLSTITLLHEDFLTSHNRWNFLINSSLKHETAILILFSNNINSIHNYKQGKNKVIVGYKEKQAEYIIIPSIIFKQGFQIMELKLNGNTWKDVTLVGNSDNWEIIKNVCYEIRNFGISCDFIKV